MVIEIGNMMLAAVSSRGEVTDEDGDGEVAMPWQGPSGFKSAVRIILERGGNAPDGSSKIANDLVKDLQSLCHCDADFTRTPAHVHACPMALAVLPPRGDGMHRAVLCGKRGIDDIEILTQGCNDIGMTLQLHGHPNRDGFDGPRAVIVETEEFGRLHHLASDASEYTDEGTEVVGQEQVPAGWMMLDLAGGLEEFRGSLGSLTAEGVQDDYLVEGRQEFDIETPRMEDIPDDQYSIPSTFSLRSYPLKEGGKGFRLWNGDGGYWSLKELMLDACMARYHVLRELDIGELILYEPERRQLLVPAGIRLPLLLERSVILCSGLLPERFLGWTGGDHELPRLPEIVSGPQARPTIYHCYREVPFEFARVLGEKLSHQIGHIRFGGD